MTTLSLNRAHRCCCCAAASSFHAARATLLLLEFSSRTIQPPRNSADLLLLPHCTSRSLRKYMVHGGVDSSVPAAVAPQPLLHSISCALDCNNDARRVDRHLVQYLARRLHEALGELVQPDAVHWWGHKVSSVLWLRWGWALVVGRDGVCAQFTW